MIIVLQNDKLHKDLARQLFDRYYGKPLYKNLRAEGKTHEDAMVEVNNLFKKKVKYYERGSMSDLLRPDDFDKGERVTFIGHGSCLRYGGPGYMESDDVDSDEKGMSSGKFSYKLVDDLRLVGYISKFDVSAIELIGCNIGLSKGDEPSYVQKFVNSFYVDTVETWKSLPEKMPPVMAFVNGGQDFYAMVVSSQNMDTVKEKPALNGLLKVTGYKTKEGRRLVAQCENEIKNCKRRIAEVEEIIRQAQPEEIEELNIAINKIKIELGDHQQKMSQLKSEHCLMLKDSQHKTINIIPRVYFDSVGVVEPQFDIIKRKLKDNEAGLSMLEEHIAKREVPRTSDMLTRYAFVPIQLRQKLTVTEEVKPESIDVTRTIEQDISISPHIPVISIPVRHEVAPTELKDSSVSTSTPSPRVIPQPEHRHTDTHVRDDEHSEKVSGDNTSPRPGKY
jgi:hypothetical protein